LASASEAAERPERRRTLLQAAGVGLGLGLLAWVVASVGPGAIARAMLEAAPWMPLVVLFDLGFFVSEVAAHRAVLGPRRADIPAARLVRASLLYYCVMVLAPLGRLGAEVARAAAYAPHVGAGRATAAAGNMQAGVLLANAIVSAPIWLAVAAAVGPGHALAWLVVVNGAGTALLGTVTWLLVRRSRVGRWLAARFPRFAKLGQELDEAGALCRREMLASVGFCSLARLSQVAQYAALLGAIGASVSLSGSLVAMGVHLVGAAFGDLVPNQIGIQEGAYQFFADAVGLAADPARAVSIALLTRVSQLLVAGSSLLALFFTRHLDAAPAPEPAR